MECLLLQETLKELLKWKEKADQQLMEISNTVRTMSASKFL